MEESHSGNIRDRNVVARQLWDWGFLNECFAPTRVRLMDIDGIVERRGHFLILDGKPVGVKIKVGQMIALEALAKLPKVTVVIVEGKPSGVVEYITVVGHSKRQKATTEEFKQRVKKWFNTVNR